MRTFLSLMSLLPVLALVDAEWGRGYGNFHVSLGRFITPIMSANDCSVSLDVSQWSSSDVSVRNEGSTTSGKELTLMASTKSRVRQFALPHKQDHEDPAQTIPPDIRKGVTQPFVKTSIWERLSGGELESPQAIENLVQTGLTMTMPEGNEWITWKATDKISEEAEKDDLTKETYLERGEILCYLGRCKKDQDVYYGGKLPVIKTISIIPMMPQEMAELLLDSSRVKTYNKLSLGRTDMKQIEGIVGCSKIVRNLTKPPIGDKLQATTLIHARELDHGSYLVVSRAVPFPESLDDKQTEYGKTEILLGVNLMVPHSHSSSRVTSVTHVYSSALPAYLAARVGVSSAINFVRDLRDLVQPR